MLLADLPDLAWHSASARRMESMLQLSCQILPHPHNGSWRTRRNSINNQISFFTEQTTHNAILGSIDMEHTPSNF